MTTHHNVYLVATKTDLKLTYRDGKFKKIEHLRGTLNESIIKNIGIAIPPKESDLNTFIAAMEGRVIYTDLSVNKEKTMFSKFNDLWFSFYAKESQGRKPKFTGADGKALNQIIVYLIDESEGDEAAALSVWNFILENWKYVPEFYRKQKDLKIINSKLNIIISELSSKHTSNERTFRKAAESESARAFKFGSGSK